MRNKNLNQYVEGKNKNNVFFVYVKSSASESLTDRRRNVCYSKQYRKETELDLVFRTFCEL